MKFLWPEAFWLFALVPVLVAAYVWLLRRKKKAAVRYASLSMVKEALAGGPRWRRHVPPLLFLLSLITLVVAIARPTAVVTLPSQHDTIILAMDVSGSMRATDVQPNRLVAAQNAAKAFIDDQPSTTRIGVVTFAGTAAIVQPPTNNRDDLFGAIERMQLQRATAIGSGILVSLKAIFPDQDFDLSSTSLRKDVSRKGAALDSSRKGDNNAKDAKPVPPGSNTSAAIILLTDGQTTTGPDPIEAARIAADRGIKVFTVGVGTVAGEVIGFEGWSMRVRLDEDALKQIANITRGEYFYAGTSASDLKKIYQNLNSKVVLETKDQEVTALFAAAAAAIALIAGFLSVLWFNRIL